MAEANIGKALALKIKDKKRTRSEAAADGEAQVSAAGTAEEAATSADLSAPSHAQPTKKKRRCTPVESGARKLKKKGNDSKEQSCKEGTFLVKHSPVPPLAAVDDDTNAGAVESGAAAMQASTAPHQIAAADTTCAVEEVLALGTAAQADASASPLTEPAKKRKRSECTLETLGVENIDQKKRHNCSGKTPSPSEIVKDAKAVGEQLEGSMPAEPAAQPAQTLQTCGGAAAGNDKAAALTTSTNVEEMREKQEKQQGEGGNDQTVSQLTLAGVSQSPPVPLNSKDDPQKAADAPRQKNIRSFYAKRHQPAFIVGPSKRGSGLQARLNPEFNPLPTQSSAPAPRPTPAFLQARARAERHYMGGMQPFNKQAPMPLARAALSPFFCDRPDRAEHESIASASEAAEQQAWEEMKLEVICEALDSLEDGTCRVELESKVKDEIAQCLTLGASKIILVTGPQDAGESCTVAAAIKAIEGPGLQSVLVVGNKSSKVSWPGCLLLALGYHTVVSHEADLARLQHVVTMSSQHDGSPLPVLVVVIDQMRVVNSPTSHTQLLDLFHLTRMDNSRLVLVCTGHETAFTHLDTQGTISIHFPVYSNAEICEAITQQTKKWPDAFTPDALAYLASSEMVHKGSLDEAASLCKSALRVAAHGRLQKLTGSGCGTWVDLVTKTIMEQTILWFTPDMTKAEVLAKWKADKLEKDALVEEQKAKMIPCKSFKMWSKEWRQDRLRSRQERVTLHLLQSKSVTPRIQWEGFRLEEMPSQAFISITTLQDLPPHAKAVLCVMVSLMNVHVYPPPLRLDWYPEYDPVSGSKQWKLMPTVNGRKAVVDPDAEPQDACGRTCNLLRLEDMSHAVVTKSLFCNTLWRLEFVKAWKLLINSKVLKSTGAKLQPTGLQLVIPEWHLRAAFENDQLMKLFVSKYEEVLRIRIMQRTAWGGRF